MSSSHTMEYYSAIKRNGVLIHLTTRLNPENIMLSERSQNKNYIQYDSIYMKCPK